MTERRLVSTGGFNDESQPTWLERQVTDRVQEAGGMLQEGAKQAGEIIGAYLGAPGTAFLIRLLYKHFLDLDHDMDGKPWGKVQKGLSLLEESGGRGNWQQRRQILDRVLGPSFRDYYRQRQKDTGGGELSEEERALAGGKESTTSDKGGVD